jgi:hypothetical protein
LLTAIAADDDMSAFTIVPSAIFALVTASLAIVVVNVTFPVPSNDTAGAVTSPDSEKSRAVCNAVAVAALPVMLPLIALLNVHVPVTVSFCVKFP